MPKVRGGYRPSRYDGRDVSWEPLLDFGSSILLNFPIPKDQGNHVDSCTAMAVVTAMEIIDGIDGRFTPLSPLYNYYHSRTDPRYLGPVELRKSLDAAAIYGVCQLQLHDPGNTPQGALMAPNDIAKQNAPSQALVAYDPQIGVPGYYELDWGDREANWKSALTSGRPVIAGIHTQQSYWDGYGMLDDEASESLGAHAITVVGYDDTQQVFTVLDSRGFRLTPDGCWYLGYGLLNTGRIIESWTITTINYNY